MDSNVVVNNENAVIYARYSSDSQTEQSIEGQVHVITDYAKRNNIQIVGSYIDRAISGLRDDRPEFQRMISDSKKKKFGYVLVYKYDRFSRDRFNSLFYKKELKKNGVKVVSVTEYISNDAQGVLFESIIDGYSEFYSAELSQKVRRGNRESRLKGLYTGGIVPYGYKIVDKKYVIVPEEAAIIKKIFEDVAAGISQKKICDELKSKGITNRGKDFIPTFISKVLRNEKYIGKVTTNGEVYTNIVPPIVDEELFSKSKAISNTNKRLGSRNCTENVFFLSKKVFCGECGKTIITDHGTSKTGRIYNYYKCSNVKFKTGECDLKAFQKDTLENFVIENLKMFLIHSNYFDKIAKFISDEYNSHVTENARVLLNEKELARNKKETDNLINALASGISSSAIKEKLEKLEEEKIILETEKIKLSLVKNEKIKAVDIIKFLTEVLIVADDSNEYKKYLADKFIKRVDVFKDRILLSINPLEELLEPNDDNSNNNEVKEIENGYVKPLKFLDESSLANDNCPPLVIKSEH